MCPWRHVRPSSTEQIAPTAASMAALKNIRMDINAPSRLLVVPLLQGIEMAACLQAVKDCIKGALCVTAFQVQTGCPRHSVCSRLS